MAKKSYLRKDPYYKKAKRLGYKSRASFKLLELNDKFKILKSGMHVIDLGSAPGSWLDILAEQVGPEGLVVGVDTEPCPNGHHKNVSFIQGDIREERVVQHLLSELGRRVDLVVSDLAPHLSGIKFQDHYNSLQLARRALHICQLTLRENGSFLVKTFPGEDLESFKNGLKETFFRVITFIPDSTRKSSTEIYLLAKGFRPREKPALIK